MRYSSEITVHCEAKRFLELEEECSETIQITAVFQVEMGGAVEPFPGTSPTPRIDLKQCQWVNDAGWALMEHSMWEPSVFICEKHKEAVLAVIEKKVKEEVERACAKGKTGEISSGRGVESEGSE